MYTDQPGCFPATSSNGNKYIMVLVEIEGNYINAEPMKSKTEGAMIKANLILCEQLRANGIVKPTTHIMDNKASAEYKKRNTKELQLVPPNNHIQNLAERAIQTFKSSKQYLPALMIYSQWAYGTSSHLRQVQPSTSYANPMLC
jgi:hypothetical protein